MSILESTGAAVRGVRRPEELTGLDGIVLPGGESTTIDKLLRAFDLLGPLHASIVGGLPAFGACAGMILLANRILDGTSDQQTLAALDITVRRNAFGRQIDSFETDLVFADVEDPTRPIHGVFIRAPWVEECGPTVEVLAALEPTTGQQSPAGEDLGGRIVAVRDGFVLATAFHPEVTGDPRVHRLFVRMVRDS